jgi:hypothetical protein
MNLTRIAIFWLTGVAAGLCLASALHTSPPPRPSPIASPPGSVGIRQTLKDEMTMLEAQSMVSNLLHCREKKVREACAPRPGPSGVIWVNVEACRQARANVLGDGLFERLKALRGDRDAQRQIAALALNSCELPENDPMQEGLAALLQAPLKEGR